MKKSILNLVWVYTVSWCLSYQVQIPCPDQPNPDEFGRMHKTNISCSVMHTRTEKDCDHIKRFESIDSAQAFIKRAKGNEDVEYIIYFQDRITDIKLDSLQELRGE